MKRSGTRNIFFLTWPYINLNARLVTFYVSSALVLSLPYSDLHYQKLYLLYGLPPLLAR